MNLDLSSALRDAADRAAGHRDAIPAGPVLTRIRRRHAARVATNGAVGVAAAGAVAFGGLQLVGREDAPPAGPTPTSSPGIDALTCGVEIGDVTAGADQLVDVDLTLPAGAEVLETGVLEATVRTSFRTDAGIDDGLGHATSVVAVRGGVVVGVMDAEQLETVPLSGLLGAVEQYELAPRSCDGDTALAAGEYELYVQVADVAMEDGSTAAGPFLGEPVAITVRALPVMPEAGSLPACGESIDGLTSTAGQISGDARLQVGVTDTTTDEFLPEGYGDVLWVELPLTNDGPATLEQGLMTGQEVVLTRDGVVVARYADLDEDFEGATGVSQWAPGGSALSAQLLLDADDCAGEYLGAGSYVLWARAEGEAAASEEAEPQEFSVLYDPVPFTIHEFEDPDNESGITWTSDGPVREEEG